jgi:hypothetical protein
MPDFIDVTWRVRKERLGDLIFDMPTYVQPVSINPIRDKMNATLAKSLNPKLLPKPKKPRSISRQQNNVLKAVTKGAVDLASIMAHTKMRRTGSTQRCINNMLEKGLIMGSNGNYAVRAE